VTSTAPQVRSSALTRASKTLRCATTPNSSQPTLQFTYDEPCEFHSSFRFDRAPVKGDTVLGRRLKVRRGTRPKRTLTWSLDFSTESVSMAHKQKHPRTSQTQPEPTKKPRTSVPPPQSARIARRFISGESIRKIAREENRDRETVKRIVQARDIQEYVVLLRAKFFEVGADAVDAVQHQLRDGKDGRLGLEVLRDVGAVPTKRELYEITSRPCTKVLADEFAKRFGTRPGDWC
jgi:hypothetical protein